MNVAFQIKTFHVPHHQDVFQRKDLIHNNLLKKKNIQYRSNLVVLTI